MAEETMEVGSCDIARIDCALALVVAFLAGSITTTLLAKASQPTETELRHRTATEILQDMIQKQRDHEWHIASQFETP